MDINKTQFKITELPFLLDAIKTDEHEDKITISKQELQDYIFKNLCREITELKNEIQELKKGVGLNQTEAARFIGSSKTNFHDQIKRGDIQKSECYTLGELREYYKHRQELEKAGKLPKSGRKPKAKPPVKEKNEVDEMAAALAKDMNS